MNRSFISVIAGGFGTDGSSAGDDRETGEHREITAEEALDAEKLLRHYYAGVRDGGGAGAVSVAEITENCVRAVSAMRFRHSSGGGCCRGI